MELFEAARPRAEEKLDLTPLADRMRPERMEDFVGQEHLLGPGRFLRSLIEKDQLQSLILWGPPGTGKTTLASIIAHSSRSRFIGFLGRAFRGEGDPPGGPGSGGTQKAGPADDPVRG